MSTTGSSNDGQHQPSEPTSNQAYETMSPDQLAADDHAHFIRTRKEAIAIGTAAPAIANERLIALQPLLAGTLMREQQAEVEQGSEAVGFVTQDVVNLSMRDRSSSSDTTAQLVSYDCLESIFASLIHDLYSFKVGRISRHVSSDHWCCTAKSQRLRSSFRYVA
jgi:hypothetical protein